ncbi:MAG: FAD-dependent oxidoreductase [Burkholderiales bacterium]|nr:FAD-dependent oxidoreductase [Burkholderiales bacterium]
MARAPDCVLVIGAGIVGLGVAHALSRSGRTVVVADANAPGSGASAGNAGAISSGSVAPLALPGVLKSARKMLLDPESPLHVPLAYLPQASPWLWRFVRAAGIERVNGIAAALAGLLRGSLAAHQRIAAEVGCAERIVAGGQLHCYPDQAALARDAFSWALKRAHGQKTEEVAGAAIRDLEPAVAARYTRALFLPDEAWVDGPQEYARAIAAALAARGARFVGAGVDALARRGDDWEARTAAGTLTARQVVLAAGAWSGRLLAPLGIRVPLETQRGYHVELGAPGIRLRRQVVLADRKVFVTPMGAALRAAGTVEFGGLERPMTEARARLIGRHLRAGLDGLAAGEERLWMGHRPCMPDSMPVIGPASGAPGLFCAFGHGHLGLTGAARTGELLARLLGGGDAPELAPFSIARFA